MNRDEILETAQQYVSADRNQQYGEPEDNFALIGDYWSVYLGSMHPGSLPDAYDVALLLGLMKVARASRRPKNADSLIDLAGYAACAGEILEKQHSVAARPITLEELARASKAPWPRTSRTYPAPSQPDD
jgi:hypothetical protein